MKLKVVIFCLATFMLFSLHATSTMYCQWHAAYFDVYFVGNYGSSADQKYVNDVVIRAQVVMQLDSIFKNLRRDGKLEHFKRWTLVDSYVQCYEWKNGSGIVPCDSWIEGDSVYLCLTDSISINKILKKLWHIEGVVFSPNKTAGMCLYSLHLKLFKDHQEAHQYADTLGLLKREDENFLWLFIKGGIFVHQCFYQHETDGYYHIYTGLYLTTKNVLEAQKILFEKYDLKTTITSHYITPAIIGKYAYY